MKPARHLRRRWIWGIALTAGALHTALELSSIAGVVPDRMRMTIHIAAGWLVVFVVTPLLVRKMDEISQALSEREQHHTDALGDIRRLETQNAVLRTIAGAGDIVATLGTLAQHVARLVPCDSVLLAFTREDGRSLETFVSPTDADAGPQRRRDAEFPVKGTVLGRVVADRRIVRHDDLAALAPDAFDANDLVGSGVASLIAMPLEAKERTLGALALGSRRPAAFSDAHIAALRPIADLLAMTIVSQQLQASLARLTTTEAMADVMMSFSNDINSALQTIVGQCEVAKVEHASNPAAHELRTIALQAERIAVLLRQLRDVAEQRLRAVGLRRDIV